MQDCGVNSNTPEGKRSDRYFREVAQSQLDAITVYGQF